MDGIAGVERNSKNTKLIYSYNGQEDEDGHDRLRPKRIHNS